MKAILVIDMPYKCEDCPLLDTTDIVHNDGDYAYCHALHKPLKNISITQFINVRKPKNCPLKPITDVIPVEYIKEWVKRDDDFWSPNLLDYFNKLYDDWRKENE